MQEAVQLLEPEHARGVRLPTEHPGRLDLLELLAISGPDVFDFVLHVHDRQSRHIHSVDKPIVRLVPRALVLVRGRTEVPQALVVPVVADKAEYHLVVEHGQGVRHRSCGVTRPRSSKQTSSTGRASSWRFAQARLLVRSMPGSLAHATRY